MIAAQHPRPGDDVTFAAVLAAERDLAAYEVSRDPEARDRFLKAATALIDLLGRWASGQDTVDLPEDVTDGVRRVVTARYQLLRQDVDARVATARRVAGLEAQVDIVHQLMFGPSPAGSRVTGPTLARAAMAIIERGLPHLPTDDPSLRHLAAALRELGDADRLEDGT